MTRYLYDIMTYNDTHCNDTMTLLNSKQIYTYESQYTIRLTNDNTYIK